MVNILASISEFERELIHARMTEGRKRAKASGVKFGPKFKLNSFQRQEALARLAAGETQAVVARTYGVDPAIYLSAAEWGAMRLQFCVACGSKTDLQHHHLVTRAEGGSDDPSNLITLCCGCRLKLSASQRTLAALAAAKARGVLLGGLRDKSIELQAEAIERAGLSYRPLQAPRTQPKQHSWRPLRSAISPLLRPANCAS